MARKFIVFEGLDGSGITTQSTLLRNYFLGKGKEVVLTKEQTDGIIGGLIKSCLKGEWKTDPLTLQMLFVADRNHHLKNEIEPALRKNKIVISDRYVLSTIAYGSLDLPTNTLKNMNANFRKPDMTFIIDTQPRICIERIKKARHHTELFEQEQKLEQIRRNYLSLKGYFPETYLIDGNGRPEDVFNEIVRIVTRY
jgi:dTMP kinase